jgi:hypothetical protein
MLGFAMAQPNLRKSVRVPTAIEMLAADMGMQGGSPLESQYFIHSRARATAIAMSMNGQSRLNL